MAPVTIRRGQTWGEAGPLAPSAPMASSDAELATLVRAAVLAGRPVEVGLLGGDLCRTVAGPGDRARLSTAEAQRLPVDIGFVALDDEAERAFAAHVVIGRLWRGRLVAAMNAQFIGRFDVAPRSHPNDGRLDVVDANLRVPDRVKAWRRLPTGLHVPHPGITERRVTELVVELDRAAPVHVDGFGAGLARRVRLRLVPDAATIVI